MDMTPDINTFATRRLLRLLYIEQLSRAHVSPNVPPADATEIPLVVLVGDEAVGKGTLARKLVEECSDHIEQALIHTTAPYHVPDTYKVVSREKFDDMLLAGELLTYSESDGESYGLSREEAAINEGKIKIVCMDLIGALMLKLRGLRPYLILITCHNKLRLVLKQKERKTHRNVANQERQSLETPLERSTLQVLLSGRIIITGILNEIILSLPEEKEKSEFVIESECSLMMDSEQRQAAQDYVRGFNTLLTLLASSTTSLEDACKHHEKSSQLDPSLYSLYKESQGTDEYTSFANGQNSYQERNHGPKHADRQSKTAKNDKPASISRPKSVDFSRYASSTWKVPDSAKSSKSVTFTSQDNGCPEEHATDPFGLLIEPRNPAEKEDKTKTGRSISTKVPWKNRRSHPSAVGSGDDFDLWQAFLLETGLLQASSLTYQISDTGGRHDTRLDDPDSIMRQLADYHQEPGETPTTNIRDEYEDIHRKCPGIFWDTVTTDNMNDAFQKAKGIIFNIFKSQPNFKPMFDIDFANLKNYPTVESKLDRICKEIAPQRLFY